MFTEPCERIGLVLEDRRLCTEAVVEVAHKRKEVPQHITRLGLIGSSSRCAERHGPRVDDLLDVLEANVLCCGSGVCNHGLVDSPDDGVLGGGDILGAVRAEHPEQRDEALVVLGGKERLRLVLVAQRLVKRFNHRYRAHRAQGLLCGAGGLDHRVHALQDKGEDAANSTGSGFVIITFIFATVVEEEWRLGEWASEALLGDSEELHEEGVAFVAALLAFNTAEEA